MAISTQPKLNKNSAGGADWSGEADKVGERVGVCAGVEVGACVGVGVGFTVIITALEAGDVTGGEALSVTLQVTEAELPNAV